MKVRGSVTVRHKVRVSNKSEIEVLNRGGVRMRESESR